MAEIVIRGGTVITPEGARVADVEIDGGLISSVGNVSSGGGQEIDARGKIVLPGAIDVHLHFNDPGRADWEGAGTGSRALATGGGTAFFDMPLNSAPCTVNAAAFAQKLAALESAAVTDFGIWGGLIPGSVEHMEELAELGVVGYKAFLCDSGLPEFPRADDLTLLEGMSEAARLNLPVAVHAESQEITTGLAKRFESVGKTAVRDFLRSRPVIAEVEAIHRAGLIARETGARLHIVHISSGAGVAAALESRAAGTDISIETCAHYLWFTEEDMGRLEAVAKCAPPLRTQAEQDALWNYVLNGSVQMVASDHSPAPPSMKTGDFWRAWGGIAGVQSTLAVLFEQGVQRRGLSWERIAQLLGREPARRFRIARKGSISPGYDADLTLVDPRESWTLEANALQQRHPISPYVGCPFHGKVARTIRRGETIYDGSITAKSTGRLLRPERN